jgi:hypothetical protein
MSAPPGPGRKSNAQLRAERRARVELHRAKYLAPEATLAAGTLAAAAALPVPAAAALIAAPHLADLALRRLPRLQRRRPLRNELRDTARIQRRWTSAVVRAGATTAPTGASLELDDPVGPRPVRVTRTPSGHRLELRSPKGYGELQARLDKVEGLLDCEVVLKVDPVRKSRAVAILRERDSLHGIPPVPSPLADPKTATRSVWDPLPVGIDDDHEPVTLRTFGNGHVLVAGATGSGKTVALNNFIADSVLDPDCETTIIDAVGGADYTPWENTTGVTLVADTNPERAATALETTRDRLLDPDTGVLARLKRAEQDRVERGQPVHRIILDETGRYLNSSDTENSDRFRDALLDLLQISRKFGCQFVVGMQRPAATQIPKDLVEQLAYRLGFRVTSATTRRMIFEDQDAPRLEEIPENDMQGVGYVKPEGGGYTRIKAYLLTRDDMLAIAARAGARDLDAELAALPAPDPPVRAEKPVEPPGVRHDVPVNEEPIIVAEPSGDDHDLPTSVGRVEDRPDAPDLRHDDPVLLAVLRAVRDIPDEYRETAVDGTPGGVRRDGLPGRKGIRQQLGARYRAWHVPLRDVAVPDGLLRVRKGPVGVKGGQPPKLYYLTERGWAVLDGAAGNTGRG